MHRHLAISLVLVALCAAPAHADSVVGNPAACGYGSIPGSNGNSTSSSSTNPATASDPDTCEIEPLLTRSHLAPVYESGTATGLSLCPGCNRLAQANIKALSVGTNSSLAKITATLTLQQAAPADAVAFAGAGIDSLGGASLRSSFPELEARIVAGCERN